MFYSARKPPKFSKSKSKKKKNTTDCKKAKAEHVAVKTAAMLEEKQSVGNATACDEKGPVKTDLNLESVQFAPGLPEIISLHFDNSQTDGKEENVSVAKEPLADGKGNALLMSLWYSIYLNKKLYYRLLKRNNNKKWASSAEKANSKAFTHW